METPVIRTRPMGVTTITGVFPTVALAQAHINGITMARYLDAATRSQTESPGGQPITGHEYLITARCNNPACRSRAFETLRRVKPSADPGYFVSKAPCPSCGSWATVTHIEERGQ